MSNAEEIKSRARPYDVGDHYQQSLKGAPVYYRVGLNSGFKRADTTSMDAVFDVAQVFPNQNAKLLRGEWQVFLESFEGKLDSQIAKTNIKLCLPDLVRSSQDYVMTDVAVCRSSDAVAHIPIQQAYRRPQQVGDVDGDGDDDAADDAFDTLAPLPVTLSNVIGADSIGVKVDPVTLFSGQVRVLLRDEHHNRLDKAGGTPLAGGEGWRATLLFVHRA
jgi:hypothetical protein